MKSLSLFLFFAAVMSAQEFRGTILGTVRDPTGASVPGAVIDVINTATNAAAHTTSNGAGSYSVPFLLPGEYTLSVAHPGFRKSLRQGIQVDINAQVALDFALEIGDASEKITVSGAAPLLDTASADLGQVVGQNYVTQVAVSLSRNVVNITHLAGGVTGGTGTYTSNAQSNISISGGGSTRGRNEFLVDGIPNTVPQGGGLVSFVPSLDSVQEVKVHTTLFDAAYGHSNGGAINITTRGGTNDFHGAAYLFKRWKALNANSWSNNRLGLDKPPVDYHQWGYTVGGPIWIPGVYNGRNRTFFTTSLERDSDKRDLSLQSRVPTDLERQGDFSQTLNRTGGRLTLYDPVTTVVTGSTANRQPFANVRIPAARIDPTGSAVMAVFPKPNIAGTPQIGQFNWAASGVYGVDQRQISGRVDHALSDNQRLFVRYGALTRIQDSDKLFPGLFGAAVGGDNIGYLVRHFYNFGLDDTITFTPSFLGSFRYGMVRRYTESANGGAGLDPAALKVPTTISSNQAVGGWPIFRLGENTATVGSTASREANDLHALLATFTKLSGRHSIKFGVDYRLIRWNRVVPGNPGAGDFSFNSTFTQADPFTARSADTSGSGMASLLLGLPTTGSSLGYSSPVSLQNHYLGGFIQEDWRISSRLTLNFGLRYELETPYTERYNRMSYTFDRSAKLPAQPAGLNLAGGILFAGVNGSPRRGGVIDGNNFGPRFGFAHSPGAKTVIRGGYGLFYSGQSFNSAFLSDVGTFSAVTPYVGSTDGDATVFTTLANPFPNGLRKAAGSAAGLAAQLGDSLQFFEERRVSPYNQQWQLSVQRELPAQILVEAAYTGMLSLKQFEDFDLNEKPDRFLALGAAENNRVPNPFLNVFPPTSTLGQGSTITQRRLWSTYPQFTTLTLSGANTGRAIYHALQLKAEKRMTRGLNFLLTYTKSKLMDNNTTSVVNTRYYRAVSPLDQAQVLNLAFTYALPFHFTGGGFNRLWQQALGGWSTSGFLTLASGTPLSITQANGRPLRIRNPKIDGAIGDRLGDRKDASGRIVNPFFDTTAFQALPNQYTVSPEPAALNELRAPGTKALNLSVFKAFALRERLKLEVRLESTSVTNTPNFNPPGVNMSNAGTFGVISAADAGSRSMQGGARLVF